MKENLKLLMAGSAIAFSIVSSVKAAETDQFYAKNAIIKDSSSAFNDFFHEKIQIALDKMNRQKEISSCRLVASEVLQQILGERSLKQYLKDRSFSKISVYSQHSPLVDRYPEDSISGGEYRKNSIYKKRPFPVNIVGIAQTLNINGIHIGTDKMGHFSIIGKAYYSNFLEELAQGKSEAEAERIAIYKGFKQEIALLGYTVGGTISFGDLEANYQGFRFGKDLCDGERPYLKLENGQWKQNPEQRFDVRTYINPKMDEAYNVSFWAPRMWKRMKNDITEAYCINKVDPDFLARKLRYDSVVKSTINDQVIADFLKENPKFNRDNQLLSKNIKCN